MPEQTIVASEDCDHRLGGGGASARATVLSRTNAAKIVTALARELAGFRAIGVESEREFKAARTA
jgi:hypothetical protein